METTPTTPTGRTRNSCVDVQPVILLHGLAGFVRLFGLAYFRGVVDDLRTRGVPAHSPKVHPTASIAHRANHLQTYLDENFGRDPVHLVGHSMGGLDARYLASPNGLNHGDRILTITTIGTPHRGSSIASFTWRAKMYRMAVIRPIPLRSLANVDDETRQFYRELRDCRWDGVHDVTPSYLQKEFNLRIIDHPSVRYFSFAGKMGGCGGAPLWLPLVPQWLFLRAVEGPNDGLVAVESCKWGTFLGTLPASHVDLVGHLYPRTRIPFDRLKFYRDLVAGLERFENGEEMTTSLPPRTAR